MTDKVIPLEELGKRGTVKVYNQAYVDKLEEKISILLSCKNCPENKGGLLCQKEYEDKCLSQKIQYTKELKEEIAELEKELEQAKKVQVVEHFEAYGQCRDSRRIAGLEQENAELKDKLNNLSKVAEVRLANWQKYEQENAELKEINEGYCKSRDRLVSIGLPTFMSCKETVNKLKEAKEIIKQFLNDYPVITKELLDKLEQFIKENNNEQART